MFSWNFWFSREGFIRWMKREKQLQFVDESLRGQGVAGKLMQAVVDYAKAQGKQISPTCSYAVKWFEKHGEYQSLLNKSKL